jgi:hypothetical protein
MKLGRHDRNSIGHGFRVAQPQRVTHDGRVTSAISTPRQVLPASVMRVDVTATNAGPGVAIVSTERDLAFAGIGVRLNPDLTPVHMPDPTAEVWVFASGDQLTTNFGQPITTNLGQPIGAGGETEITFATITRDWQ